MMFRSTKARSTEDVAPCAGELYLGAARSSNLRLVPERTGDVDRLASAAFAVAGSPRKQLALRVYRLRATGDMSGARSLAHDLADLMRRKSVYLGNRGQFGVMGRRPDVTHLTPEKLRAVAMTVLKWWQMPTCPVCEGRKHPLIPNSPGVDESRACSGCHGTGHTQLERMVRQEHTELVRWLVGEMEGLCAAVLRGMARSLHSDSDEVTP